MFRDVWVKDILNPQLECQITAPPRQKLHFSRKLEMIMLKEETEQLFMSLLTNTLAAGMVLLFRHRTIKIK